MLRKSSFAPLPYSSHAPCIRVNKSLCEGGPGYDECELLEEFAEVMKGRVDDPDAEAAPHRVFKVGTDGPTLGGKQ